MTILYWGRVTSRCDVTSDYEDHSDTGLLGAYFSFDKVRLTILSVLVAMAIVGAIGLFIAQYGLNAWERTITRAKSLMVINFDTTVPVSPAPFASPIGAVQNQTPITEEPVTLYICPSCGIVRYPRLSTNSVPLCPYCGVVLNQIIQRK